MKRAKGIWTLATLTLIAAGLITGCQVGDSKVFWNTMHARTAIISAGETTADGQLAANGTQVINDWIWGTFYAGLADFSHISSKAPAYRQALMAMGDKTQWKLRTHPNDLFHADDFCIGQALLDLYAEKHDPAIIADLTRRLDGLVDHINAEKENVPDLTWWWCDALFMAPEVMTRMSAITGNPKYIDAMDKEWWRTTARFYDQDEHLFYRDKRFIAQKTSHGKKVFWSRGNGWVYAGTVRVLNYMPANYPTRQKYLDLHQQMAAKLATLQRADGTWNPSLIDPQEFGGPEISGTAFFCYGTVWGINHGTLDKKKYLPVISNAWAAMQVALRPDGRPGFVQAVSDRPNSVTPESTQLYASGGYLLSAVELVKLAPLPMPEPPTLKAAAATAPTAR